MNFVETKATVILPSGDSSRFVFSRWGRVAIEGDFQQKQAGTSVVNVNFAQDVTRMARSSMATSRRRSSRAC